MDDNEMIKGSKTVPRAELSRPRQTERREPEL